MYSLPKERNHVGVARAVRVAYGGGCVGDDTRELWRRWEEPSCMRRMLPRRGPHRRGRGAQLVLLVLGGGLGVGHLVRCRDRTYGCGSRGGHAGLHVAAYVLTSSVSSACSVSSALMLGSGCLPGSGSGDLELARAEATSDCAGSIFSSWTSGLGCGLAVRG